jgi:hypothetical protein
MAVAVTRSANEAQLAPRRCPVRSQQPVLLPVQATLDGICEDWDVIDSGENFININSSRCEPSLL